jgi:hypothetical protein
MNKIESLFLGVVLLYLTYTIYLDITQCQTVNKLIFNVVLISVVGGFGIRFTLKGLGVYNPKYTQ